MVAWIKQELEDLLSHFMITFVFIIEYTIVEKMANSCFLSRHKEKGISKVTVLPDNFLHDFYTCVHALLVALLSK